jgi:hypothetical protein
MEKESNEYCQVIDGQKTDIFMFMDEFFSEEECAYIRSLSDEAYAEYTTNFMRRRRKMREMEENGD